MQRTTRTSSSISTLSEGVRHPRPSGAVRDPHSGVGFPDGPDPDKGAKQLHGIYRSQRGAQRLGK